MANFKFNSKEFRNKLEQTKEFHAYPKAQHTPKDAEAKPLMDDKVDFVSAIKSGAKIGYADISMLNVPKSVFKVLQSKTKGAAEYSPYSKDADLVVVDKMYYTKKHLEADEAGIPCISFHEVLAQLAESKDKDIQNFMENSSGKIIMNNIEKFMTADKAAKVTKKAKEPAKKAEKPSWLKA